MKKDFRHWTARLVLLVVAVVAFCSVAQADTIFVGVANGDILGREEYYLVGNISQYNINMSGFPISSLLCVGDDIAIGLNTSSWYNVDVRHINEMTTARVGQMATGFAITTLGYRATDDALLIGDANCSWVRTMDLAGPPSGYLGSPEYGWPWRAQDGGSWGEPVTQFRAFSTGEFLLGTATNGFVTVRRADSLAQYPSYTPPGHGYATNSTKIVGLATLNDTNFVVVMANGSVQIQPKTDVWTRVGPGPAYMGGGLCAFTMLANGKFAIGFTNGDVFIRDSADIFANVTGGYGNFGGSIGALASTSNGNIVIAAGNQVYVRKVTDLTSTPVGFVGPDGIDFGGTVNALACQSAPPAPEPAVDLFIGTSDGYVRGRDEFQLSVGFPQYDVNMGFTITALTGAQQDLVIGTNRTSWYNVEVRRTADMAKTSEMATGNPISVLGYRPNDDAILIGDGASGYGASYVRKRTDLNAAPSDYLGNPGAGLGPTAGGNWGEGVSVFTSFPDNGDFLIGTGGPNGFYTVRPYFDIWEYPSYMVSGHGSGTTATKVVGLRAIDNTKFVQASDNGAVQVIQRNDMWARIGSVAYYGGGLTAFEMLPNGKFAIGFSDGHVAVRDTANLAAAGTDAYFGAAINALELTGNGNLAIASGSKVFVRSVPNITARPDGAYGVDGLELGTTVTSLAYVDVPPYVPPTPVTTIDGAKGSDNGRPVNLSGATVTAKFSNGSGPVCFAVEDTGRSVGIRVISNKVLAVGDKVTIVGETATVSGERVINVGAGHVDIESSGNSVPTPLGLTNRTSGGGAKGLQGAVADVAPSKMSTGLNNVGLLVKVWGMVTFSNYTGDLSGYFYVDDGSGIDDGSGYLGIRCRVLEDLSAPYEGSPAVATGVMGVQQIGGVNARYLWTTAFESLE